MLKVSILLNSRKTVESKTVSLTLGCTQMYKAKLFLPVFVLFFSRRMKKRSCGAITGSVTSFANLGGKNVSNFRSKVTQYLRKQYKFFRSLVRLELIYPQHLKKNTAYLSPKVVKTCLISVIVWIKLVGIFIRRTFSRTSSRILAFDATMYDALISNYVLLQHTIQTYLRFL